jgi:polysaccharide transporter, PST family
MSQGQVATPGVGRIAARGARAVMTGQAVRFLTQLGGLAILSRLLAPGDFGLVAMIVAVVGLGEIVRDLGLSSAAIQARSVTHEQRSNLMWINAATGVVLASALWIGADAVGVLYGNDVVPSIARAIAPVFVLNALAAQYKADLTRRLAFNALAMSDMIAPVCGLFAAILAAVSGAGYWSLVVQQLVLAAVALGVVGVAARWLPSWPRRGADMRDFLTFGWNFTATQVLGYAGRNVDTVVIGNRFGAEVLGVYNRAFQLLMLPLVQINAPATTVALPILSKSQDDARRFGELLVRCQAVLLNVVFAVIALCFAFAPLGVAVVLGERWDGVVPLFRLLCLAGVFQAASYVTFWGFIALGLTGSHLRFTLVTRPLLITFILLGSIWGVDGVAASYGLGIALIWPAGLWWLRKREEIHVRELFVGCLKPFAVYGAAGGGSAVVGIVLEPSGLVVSSLGSAMALIVVLAGAWRWVPSFRLGIRESLHFAAQAFRSRAARS